MIDQHSLTSAQPVAFRLGIAGAEGWQPVPHLLFRAQHKLGLNETDMVVLLNITLHRRSAGQQPFVQTSTISKRMGIPQRKVQRAVKRLVQKGMMRRVRAKRDGRSVPSFDVEPLYRKLANIAASDPASWLSQNIEPAGQMQDRSITAETV